MEPVINLVAVFVAAIVSMVLGMIWYGPLFGKTWMKLSGMKEKDMGKHKDGMMKSMVIGFITTLVSAYVLAHFVDYADATSVMAGALTGFWVWLGFIATITAGSVIWEGKSVGLYLLNNAHNLLNMLVMGAILAVWV